MAESLADFEPAYLFGQPIPGTPVRSADDVKRALGYLKDMRTTRAGMSRPEMRELERSIIEIERQGRAFQPESPAEPEILDQPLYFNGVWVPGTPIRNEKDYNRAFDWVDDQARNFRAARAVGNRDASRQLRELEAFGEKLEQQYDMAAELPTERIIYLRGQAVPGTPLRTPEDYDRAYDWLAGEMEVLGSGKLTLIAEERLAKDIEDVENELERQYDLIEAVTSPPYEESLAVITFNGQAVPGTPVRNRGDSKRARAFILDQFRRLYRLPSELSQERSAIEALKAIKKEKKAVEKANMKRIWQQGGRVFIDGEAIPGTPVRSLPDYATAKEFLRQREALLRGPNTCKSYRRAKKEVAQQYKFYSKAALESEGRVVEAARPLSPETLSPPRHYSPSVSAAAPTSPSRRIASISHRLAPHHAVCCRNEMMNKIYYMTIYYF